jgi:hypothetical protein
LEHLYVRQKTSTKELSLFVGTHGEQKMNKKICRTCQINAILGSLKKAIINPDFSAVKLSCKEDKHGNLPEWCPYIVEQTVSKTKNAK